MGNVNDTTKIEEIHSFMNKYDLIEERNDPRIGIVKLYKTKTPPISMIIIKTLEIGSESSKQRFLKRYEIRNATNCENIVQALNIRCISYAYNQRA